MEITKDEHNSIKELLHHWVKNSKYELETTFGQRGVVDSNTFLHIAQRLRTKRFDVIPQSDYLNIITPNGIRFTLQGLGVIEDYCRDNTIAGKTFTAMKKTNVVLPSLVKQKTDSKVKQNPIDISEYDVRFKLRSEDEITPDHPDYATVTSMINTWATVPKAFRMIRRWSFKGKGIQYDLSMVRQSGMDESGKDYAMSTTFLGAKLSSQILRHEVEVELLHDKEYKDIKDDLESYIIGTTKSLIAGVGEVLRAIQKNVLLIRKSNAYHIRNEYDALLRGKKDDKRDDRKPQEPKFRGVGPVTLQIKNIMLEMEPESTIPNIRTGYNVTDKADGMRAMGFVNEQGELYLLDQSMNVYRTGLINPAVANSLVDGEWVTQLEDGTPVNRYLIFDVYMYNQKKTSHLPFIIEKDRVFDEESDSRYTALLQFFATPFQIIQVGVANRPIISDDLCLKIIRKEFRFASGNEIFSKCAEILDSERVYNTDGLIITSNSAPIPETSGRFEKQFKWKPSKDNTVDFLVHFEKDQNGVDKIETHIDDESMLSMRYKTMTLYSSGVRNAAFDNPRDTILSQKPITDVTGNYRPVIFQPDKFSDPKAHYCHRQIRLNRETFEEFITTEITQEPIQNNSIVEMRYDPTQEPGWRWIPTRIRHDKTERLIRAQVNARGKSIKYSGMMNDEGVANSVWNSIHEPITESMIRTGNEEPSEEEMKENVARTDITKKYYETSVSRENKQLVRGLLDFHNKYIKNKTLIGSTVTRTTLLLDIACGKAGDLDKWKWANARAVLGIDIAEDNITNPINGAYKRYVQLKQTHGDRVPKIAFAVGDSSKSIVNGEAGATPFDRDIIRSVFGRVAPDNAVPPYISTVMKDTFRDGADVVSCMFAIHYFFKDEQTFKGLIRNIDETVKVDGYFIGCCFDGHEIFTMLKDVEKGHSKIGKIGNTKIWSITKEYDTDSFEANEDSLGLAIDVNFISIGEEYTEYLVSFDYLKQKLQEIGLVVYQTDLFSESFKTASKDKKTFQMTPEEKKFSFLNRWFIFKRQPHYIASHRQAALRTQATLPPLPAVLDPTKYFHFPAKITKYDKSGEYDKFIIVKGSVDYVLQPWHTAAVKKTMHAWIPPTNNMIIVDTTAHIGVDSIHLATIYPSSFVDSFEVSEETFVALRTNIKTFNKENQITPHNIDSSEWNPDHAIDILYVDPPWRDEWTKDLPSVELYLQSTNIAPNEDKNIKRIIKRWLQSGYVKNIVLKTPMNFDMSFDVYNLEVSKENTAIIRGRSYAKGEPGKPDYKLLRFTPSRDVKIVNKRVAAAPLAAAPLGSVPLDASSLEEKQAEATPPLIQLNIDQPYEKTDSIVPAKYEPNMPIKLFNIGSANGKQNRSRNIDDAVNMARWSALIKGPVDISELPTNAAVWLGASAPFAIPDKLKATIAPFDGSIENYTTLIINYLDEMTASFINEESNKSRIYPSMNHYLYGMKIKFTCHIDGKYGKSNSLYSQFTTNGLHQSFIDKYTGFEKKKTEFSKEYFEVITTEVKGIKKIMQMISENDKKLKTKLQLIGPNENTQVDEVLWDQIRPLFVDFVIKYRMKYDPIFKHILQSLNNEQIHLTYNATANNALMESGKVCKDILKEIGKYNVIKVDPTVNLSAAPSVAAPSVTPSVAAPSVAAPSVAAPSVAAPSVAAPSVTPSVAPITTEADAP